MGGTGGIGKPDHANTPGPTFTAETLDPGAASVTYNFALVVRDSAGVNSIADTVTITVLAPEFGGLVANAGADMSVASGDMVTLDGSGSTRSDSVRNVDYSWTRSSGTGGTLTGETTLTPVFTAPVLDPGAIDATFIFTLTVTDDLGSSPATDMVTVTVTDAPFADPVANAGPDQRVASGAMVELDGSGSTVDRRRTP